MHCDHMVHSSADFTKSSCEEAKGITAVEALIQCCIPGDLKV